MKKVITLSSEEAQILFGPLNNNITLLNEIFPNISINSRGSKLIVSGNIDIVNEFVAKFEKVREIAEQTGYITESQMLMIMSHNAKEEEIQSISTTTNSKNNKNVILYCPDGSAVVARTPNQIRLVEAVEKADMVFAIGPAGTGKTYTAVALALKYLKEGKVRRIVLTRPAVEAGESLGYLPGTMKEKLDPYLRPLYDALQEMVTIQKLQEMLQKEIIQIIPLAYMRGRTLNNSFVILDEAQNATRSQLKMFLTRLGHNSKFLITGDITQTDLPKHIPMGLKETIKILKGIEGIEFIFLDERDIIRHPLVAKILRAYEKTEEHDDQNSNR